MADTIKKDARRSFSNTVSAGLKSLGGRGKTFYVLEFKNNSQMHRAKTTKEIIVDYIELGRSPKCQIRFGEDCRTVSGVHCAIMREGEHYFVKHLSKSNPTLINGKPVADKYYINSGDEITLSYGGPIIGFIVPQNNLTSSIPLTRRLSLFREQAMRPYKRAIAFLSLLLLFSISGFTFYTIKKGKENDKLFSELKANNIYTKKQLDSLEVLGKITQEQNDILQSKNKNLENEIASVKSIIKGVSNSGLSSEIKDLFPSVYFIMANEIEVTMPGEQPKKLQIDNLWYGTGFLLNDGNFITARHIIQPWYYEVYDSSNIFSMINIAATAGARVRTKFYAISPSGQEFYFYSDDFQFNETNDKKETFQDEENKSFKYTYSDWNEDWAFKKMNINGKLKVDSKLSNNLNIADLLMSLGFPKELGLLKDGVKPIFSEFKVSSTGLENGFISISGRSFDQGNSGGPVFFRTSNGYRVVGIVSAGRGGSQGQIIPISKIYQ
jgi:cell division protein FtsB